MEEIIEKLKRESINQLFSYPKITKKQEIKYYLKRILRSKHTPKRDFYFWPHALLTQALEEGEELEVLKRYYDSWIKKGLPIRNIDNVMNGYSLLYVYEKTQEETYRKAADTLYQYLVQYEKEMNYSIPYRKGMPEHVYVDGVGMTAPFLCRYGAMFKKKEAMELGMKQILDFCHYGIDEASGLPYHGYHTKENIKYGIIGWGRAVGWLLLAIVDSMEYLPQGEKKRQVQIYFNKLIENVITYLREDGYFSWQLSAIEGPKDTSATAMIGYAIKKGQEFLILTEEQGCEKQYSMDWELKIKKMKDALLSSYKNGNIYDCSGECHGFSEYPQIYGAYPWSLGPGMRFLIMTD